MQIIDTEELIQFDKDQVSRLKGDKSQDLINYLKVIKFNYVLSDHKQTLQQLKTQMTSSYPSETSDGALDTDELLLKTNRETYTQSEIDSIVKHH